MRGIANGHNRLSGERVSPRRLFWRGSRRLLISVFVGVWGLLFTGWGGLECVLGSVCWMLLLWRRRRGSGGGVVEGGLGRGRVSAASGGERFPHGPSWSLSLLLLLLLLWRRSGHDPHTINNNKAADSPLCPARWTDNRDWIGCFFCFERGRTKISPSSQHGSSNHNHGHSEDKRPFRSGQPPPQPSPPPLKSARSASPNHDHVVKTSSNNP